MNIKSLVLSVATICLATTAFAYPKHTLNCRVGSGDNLKSMYFEMEDSDISTGLSHITLSNWVIPANNGERVLMADCGIIDGSCYGYVSPEWKPFQQAEVTAKIGWTFNSLSSEKVLSAIQINMGKTGLLTAVMNGPIDKFNSAKAKIQSTVMFFNFPNGVAADCYYYLATGPKPGMTGSN